MLVTYLMQQLLISIYLYPIVRIRLGIKPNRTDRKSFISRTLLAIRLSTTAFLSASAVFSIALLLASNITMAQQESTSVLATFVLSAVVPLQFSLSLYYSWLDRVRFGVRKEGLCYGE